MRGVLCRNSEKSAILEQFCGEVILSKNVGVRKEVYMRVGMSVRSDFWKRLGLWSPGAKQALQPLTGLSGNDHQALELEDGTCNHCSD